jgi:hypothetical protein
MHLEIIEETTLLKPMIQNPCHDLDEDIFHENI